MDCLFYRGKLQLKLKLKLKLKLNNLPGGCLGCLFQIIGEYSGIKKTSLRWIFICTIFH
ncbi:hypothetical protein ACI8B_210281 [Acinetobacter proteolyticus]|uniref:Uncharacterized protein n=1 Tax=Acinetobacter proteolyticus TaxID=1776741 RepID=A0A653K4J7_9GAMM|nr:hypothetical protein ACI8B_210281 [Acinetobacter proteolyticus]